MDVEIYEMLLQVACKEIARLQEELVKEKAFSKAVNDDLYLANVSISKFLMEDK